MASEKPSSLITGAHPMTNTKGARERIAAALEPELFSDDLDTRHRAASPMQWEIAQMRVLVKADAVLASLSEPDSEMVLVPREPTIIQTHAALEESRKWPEPPLPRNKELWAALIVYRAMIQAFRGDQP